MTTKAFASLRYLCSMVAMFAVATAAAGQVSTPPTELSSEDVVARVAPAVAVVFTGAGAGRLTGIGSAIIVRPDGVLLTAYHVIKDAREIQVRLKSGEIYDHVELVGVDERRDVAAIRISAANLPALSVAPLEEARLGEPIFVVSNPSGLSWSASAGVLSAVRPVEEAIGTRSGYRVLQFSAPVSPGSSGGAIVDSKGRAIGIVVFSKEGQALNFAVPLDAVSGLASGSEHTPLPPGPYLEPRHPERPASSLSLVHENSADLLRKARTVYIHSGTVWFTPPTLEEELMKQKEFREWGLAVVRDRRLADLDVEVDRPLWTYTFTVAVQDARTSMMLGSDEIIAASGELAAPSLAEKILKMMGAARSTGSAPVAKN